MPFDVVTRNIKHPDTTGWKEPYRPVQPQRSFVDITDGKRGFAVLNARNGQYEAVDLPAREIALTLLRCFRQWNSIRLAEYPDQTGSQLQGTWTFEYALYPHAGDWKEGKVMLQAQLFNLLLKSAVGEPGEGNLPSSKSFIQIEDPGIELAAVKKGEWDNSLILRLVNPSDKDITTRVIFGIPISSAELVNMKESKPHCKFNIQNGAIALEIPAKKIFTLKCRF